MGARSEASTNDPDAGVATATSPRPGSPGWGAVEGSVTRRAAGGLAARLMYARWCRRRALRSELPHTDRGDARIGRHSRDGDRCCSGGRPAHGEVLAHTQPGMSELTVVVISAQAAVSAHTNPASSHMARHAIRKHGAAEVERLVADFQHTQAFDAANPCGRAFHCHHLSHMATGMMTSVEYGA